MDPKIRDALIATMKAVQFCLQTLLRGYFKNEEKADEHSANLREHYEVLEKAKD